MKDCLCFAQEFESLMSDYSVVKSGVRLLIECKRPLISTPDVFDIYYNSVPTTDFSTTVELSTTEPPTTDSPTTEAPVETTELPVEMTTIQSSQCHFDKNEHGAIFDTGNPYQNNMRHGLLMSKLIIILSKNA